MPKTTTLPEIVKGYETLREFAADEVVLIKVPHRRRATAQLIPLSTATEILRKYAEDESDNIALRDGELHDLYSFYTLHTLKETGELFEQLVRYNGAIHQTSEIYGALIECLEFWEVLEPMDPEEAE